MIGYIARRLVASFLILIGVMLVAEGLHSHIPKGYIYFAMAFALGVELLNMRLRKVTKPVALHQGYAKTRTGASRDGDSTAAVGQQATEASC